MSSLQLLEREAELSDLSLALSCARDGHGALVVVEGPAGVGKSQLLAAAREEAESGAMRVLDARGIELEQEIPFGVVLELFTACLAALDADERDRVLGSDARWARGLLDHSGGPAAADVPTIIRGLYQLTVRLAATPLAILVDDAHSADRPSMMFLGHLAMRLEDLPVALILAARTDETPAAAEILAAVRLTPRCRLLVPAPLSETAVGRLLERELPNPEPEFVAACTQVSGGNPFLARELARVLRSEGIPPTSDSVSQVERLVPDTVLHSVLTRLARMGDTAGALAAAVAVLGDGTSLRQAIRLAQLEPRDAEDAADALADAGILAHGEPLAFTHPLIATAVHSDLPAFARARAHRTAAGLLAEEGHPAQDIAAHLLLTRPDADAWVLTTLRRAAATALAHGDPRAAALMLERALAEPPRRQERADVLLELASAQALQGDVAAKGHVLHALDLISEPRQRFQALRALSSLHLAFGSHDVASEALREVLDGVDLADRSGQQVLGEYLTANRFRTPQHPEVRTRLAPIVEAARAGSPPDDPGLLAHVALDLALDGGAADIVRRLAEHATDADPLLGIRSHGLVSGILVQALCCVDALDAAHRIADASVRTADERGAFLASASARYHRAIAMYHRGDLTPALTDLDQAQAPSREGWGAAPAWAQSLQVHVLIEQGELGLAHETLAACAAPAEAMDAGIFLFARARLALAERDPAAALADAQRAGRHLNEGFAIDHPGFVPWRWIAALAARALGDDDHARELAEEQLERARSCGVPRATALALRTVAAVAGDSTSIDRLTEALAVLEPSQSKLERAHALLDLGGALRRAGRRSDAQTPLRQALQLGDAIGALAIARAARAELRTTGARPRRAAFTGVDALTPAELRVAQLAAEGLTNRQIAHELFVSEKTVQSQLAVSYRKLDITSRRDLPASLAS